MSRRISFANACKEFALGRDRLWRWVHEGKIRYTVLSSDKRAKKLLRYEDIERLMEENEYGGEHRVKESA